MISLDTNILVRIIVNDDRRQVTRAREAILARGAVVQPTVLMETAWVLGENYDYTAADIADAFSVVAENADIETPPSLPAAIAAVRAGVDVADAFHLAHSAGFGMSAEQQREQRRAGVARGENVGEPHLLAGRRGR